MEEDRQYNIDQDMEDNSILRLALLGKVKKLEIPKEHSIRNPESLNKKVGCNQFCENGPNLKCIYKKGRMIENFILPALNSEKYGKLLQWVDKEAGIFNVYYGHQNDNWNKEDFRVFMDYAKFKNMDSSEDMCYYSRSKRRFREALRKIKYVKIITPFLKNVLCVQLLPRVYHIQSPKIKFIQSRTNID